MKKALVLAMVGLVLLAAYVLLGRERRTVEEPRAALEHSERTAPVELVEARAATNDARMPVASTPEQIPREPQPASAEDPAGIPDLILISGAIVVVNQHGVEFPNEDGSFVLFATSQGRGTGQTVAVHDGQWSAFVPCETEAGPTETLSASEVKLGGRAAISDQGDEKALSLHMGTMPLPGDAFFALRVRWPRSPVLHVRDRASGRELAPVLLAKTEERSTSGIHPGAAGEEALDLGSSPCAVPAGSRVSIDRFLRVRSPGYGWAGIEIDETTVDERFLLLDPAGELEVLVNGVVSDPGTKLRIRNEEHPLFFEQALTGTGSIVLEAVPAGRYAVAVEIGRWPKPLVLATEAVEVVADVRARVSLTVAEVTRPELVALSGTLILPGEWELSSFSLLFQLLDPPLGGHPVTFRIPHTSMKPGDESLETLQWSLGYVQPGRYRVSIQRLGFSRTLEVPQVGLEDARIEVGPPCSVSVRCVDDASGAEVEVDRVLWDSEGPSLGAMSLQSAQWNADRRRWEFRAPQGKLSISAWSERFDGGFTPVEAGPGTNEVDLRLTASTGVDVVFLDGSGRVSWDGEASVHPLEGQSAGAGWCWDGKLRHPDPGLYRLEFPEIPGYEPVPEQIVRLEKGVVKEHVIELMRRP